MTLVRPTLAQVQKYGGGPYFEGGLPWEERSGGAGPYLLDYAQSIFTRGSVAAAQDPRNPANSGLTYNWSYFDTTTPSYAINVPRIAPDGAILIESTRRNYILQSHTAVTGAAPTAPWSVLNAPTLAADVHTAPDGTATADDIHWAAGGGAGQFRQTLIAADFADNVDVIISWWLGSHTAPSTVNIFWRNKALTSFSNNTLIAVLGSGIDELQRYSVAETAGAGANGPLVALIEVDDGAEYGMCCVQVEQGLFPTSNITTLAATVARSAEFCSFANADIPNILMAGHWSVDVWPEYTQAEAGATRYLYYLDANNYLALISGTTLRMRANGVNHDIAGLVYSRYDTLHIDIDQGVAMTLTGGGGGSVALTADWSGSGAALNVGSDGAGSNACAMIGRPARA